MSTRKHVNFTVAQKRDLCEQKQKNLLINELDVLITDQEDYILEDELETLIANLLIDSSFSTNEYICIENNKIKGGLINEEILKPITDKDKKENEPINNKIVELEKINNTETEKTVNMVLRFLFEQEVDFDKVENKVKVLKSLHRRIRLSFIKNFKQ
ncbi:3439_t:CDS:2, partial [Cetraspora pellucida]